MPPLRRLPLQIGIVHLLEFLAVLSELDDLEGVDAVNEVRNLLISEAVAASEIRKDRLQLGNINLMLVTVDLLQLEVVLGGGVHVRQLGGLGQSLMALVEGAAGQQKLKGVGRVLVRRQHEGTVQDSDVRQEIIHCLEEVKGSIACLSEVLAVILANNEGVGLDLLQHQPLYLLLPFEAVVLALHLRGKLLVYLKKDDWIWYKANNVLDGQFFLHLRELVHHLCDVPLAGVLLQGGEGVLQTHIVLLGGGVLALNDVQSLLVSYVYVESDHSEEDNGDVERKASRRDLSVRALPQVAAHQQVVFLQLPIVLQQLSRIPHIGRALHVVGVHLQQVLQQYLSLVLAHVLGSIEKGGGKITNFHFSLSPNIDMAHSWKDQVLDGLYTPASHSQQGHSRLPQSALPLLPPQSNLPIVFVHLHGYIITSQRHPITNIDHQYTYSSRQAVTFSPNSGRSTKESPPKEAIIRPEATSAPEREGRRFLAKRILAASVTVVSRSLKEQFDASLTLALVAASGTWWQRSMRGEKVLREYSIHSLLKQAAMHPSTYWLDMML